MTQHNALPALVIVVSAEHYLAIRKEVRRRIGKEIAVIAKTHPWKTRVMLLESLKVIARAEVELLLTGDPKVVKGFDPVKSEAGLLLAQLAIELLGALDFANRVWQEVHVQVPTSRWSQLLLRRPPYRTVLRMTV